MKPRKPERQRPAPLTGDEIDLLTREVSIYLCEVDEAASQMLMLLLTDISIYPKENAESIANLFLSYLYMWTSGESDAAEARYVEKCRKRLLGKGGKR